MAYQAVGEIKRQALGRIGFLGSLYDIRTDTFTGDSIFKDRLPIELLEKPVEIRHTDFHLDYSSTQSEKLKQLKVDGNFKLNIMSGVAKLETSGSYLDMDKDISRLVKVDIIYRVETVEDHITINHTSVENLISTTMLSHSHATHVVTGIRWGANVIVSFENQVKSKEEKKEVQGKLDAGLNKFKAIVEVSGGASLEYQNTSKNEQGSVNIKISGDIQIEGKVPKVIEEVYDFLQTIPSAINKINDGKGKPLEYFLYPLDNIARSFKLETTIDRINLELDDYQLHQIDQEFDDRAKAVQKFDEFASEVKDVEDYLTAATNESVQKMKREIGLDQRKFRYNIAITLKRVRSSPTSEISSIDKIIEEFANSKSSSYSINRYLDQNQSLLEKIDQIRYLSKRGIKVVKYSERLKNYSRFKDKQDVYVFYTSDKLEEAQVEKWNIQYRYFLNLHEQLTQSQPVVNNCPTFIWIDYELLNDVDQSAETTIKYYKNGFLVTNDYYEYQKQLTASHTSEVLKKDEATSSIRFISTKVSSEEQRGTPKCC
ncbi:unnamed protein product [Didymodactylos carnosus]|uniref:Uncharacterized protein n=1 Tax=Didymodactylos carnosus TaxID=1234261 RepID=A0A815V0P8_9BILA|nr:unnamed protein product [Didymodactylos carnosus]CAF1529838.1 unnamed protein product [Didymodactylos carnosus]CAF4004883.1 unnamed protein product [Didymodactylos carnosus]CAF4388965.1 unnamed protein product [Didymodactylos carnosus]